MYNNQILVHITEDAEEHRSVDGYSALSFKNYQQQLKRAVRSGKYSLAQTVKHLNESGNFRASLQQLKHSTISAKAPNNVYIIDCTVCQMISMSNVDGKDDNLKLLCKLEPLIVEPCNSRTTGVCTVAICNVWMQMEAMMIRSSNIFIFSCHLDGNNS